MKIISVDAKSSSYKILIGHNIILNTLEDFLSKSNYSSILIITDSNVKNLYTDNILKSLRGKGYNAFEYITEAGEVSKSIESASKVWRFCLHKGIDRSSVIIALGGGVVGDLSGFIASTYMRGIDYIQVPTSLMAMVDSSVGGKVAINLGNIKNIVGSFYQPEMVIIDTEFLKTLPRKQLLSGLGEVVKYGLIRDYDFFTYIKEHYKQILEVNISDYIDIIELCCTLKAEIVSKDERDNNLRAILNFGHTLGHGIESSIGMGEITHGEAVAMGIVYESKIALKKGLIDKTYYEEIVELMDGLGLLKIIDTNIEQFMEIISKDKKNIGSSIRMVLPVGQGKVEVFDNIEHELIKKSIGEEV